MARAALCAIPRHAVCRGEMVKAAHAGLKEKSARAGRSAAGGSALGQEMRGTSRLIQGLRYLVGTLRRQRLIANELILHLPTIVRSFDLLLELLVVLRIRASSQHRYAR